MAVPVTDVRSFITNLQFLCESAVELDGLSNYIEIYKILYPDLMDYVFGEHQVNAMLGKLTGFTVATGTDLNCYPRGLETAIFFDVDGNEVDP